MNSDLAQFMMPSGQDDIGFHTGKVLAWDAGAGTNTIKVLGTEMANLPLLTSSTFTFIGPGVTVGILRVKSVYFVLGRIVGQDNPVITPQIPIVLHPQFISLGSAGIANEWHATVGANTNWLGSAHIVHPFIELDGLWGPYGGGTSTTLYELRINSQTVGSWTASAPQLSPPASRKGPFNVSAFMNLSGWQDITVLASPVSGSGSYYFQVIGSWFSGY